MCGLGSPPSWFRVPPLLWWALRCWSGVLPAPSCRLVLGAVLVGFLCLRCLGFVMSLSSFVSSLPVLGAVSPAVRPSLRAAGPSDASVASASAALRARLAAPAPVCPLASGAGVPSSVVVAGRVVSSSSFVPVVSAGVVSAVSAADPRGVVCVVGGRSFRCLWSALGGAGSPAAVSLVSALRAARGSGASVDLWCAPGRGGLPCPGYFCAVSAR